MAHAHEPAPKITIYHATAPTCWWSWGYEATLNRVRHVYGDQVDLQLLYGTVWEDFDEYLKHYELTIDGVNDWAREASQTMGIPIRANYTAKEPRNLQPASHATMAAMRQGREKGERFLRGVLRRFVVEGQDVTRGDVLREAATEAGLDVAAFRKDAADTEARQHDLEHQGGEFPHLPLGFYNLAITDGGDRTVLIDHAFDPKVVEEAIDYLSRGTLRKGRSPHAIAYLRAHGLAPTAELARVTGVSLAVMETRLASIGKEGRVEKVLLAGAGHWRAR